MEDIKMMMFDLTIMETETISKTGRNPKSLTSRKNLKYN
jgi:hypothetical protein